MNWLALLNPSTIIGKGIDAYTANKKGKVDKEKLQIQAKHALLMAKEKGEQEVTMTDAHWEAIAQEKSDGTWKDEYVTLIFTLPVPLIMLGTIWYAYTGDSKLLDGTIAGIGSLRELGLDWKELTYAIVLAAVGLKVWRSK